MVYCERYEECREHKYGKCNELHGNCLLRTIVSKFQRLKEIYEMILSYPEADERYIISTELSEDFNTLCRRLEENLGGERVGEMMRDSRT